MEPNRIHARETKRNSLYPPFRLRGHSTTVDFRWTARNASFPVVVVAAVVVAGKVVLAVAVAVAALVVNCCCCCWLPRENELAVGAWIVARQLEQRSAYGSSCR